MPIFRGKQFVSAESDYKDSVRVVQRTNINFNTLIYTIDNISLEHANRVLLVGQTNSAQNGIYSWNYATKKLTRSTDADSDNEVTSGLKVYVEEGDVNANTTWVLVSPGIITLGVSDLTFIRENRLGSLDIAGTYGSGSKSAVITIDEYGDISQIIEQPISVSGLPDQTGNNGKYLKSNGTQASWETLSASGGSNSYNDLTDKPNFATVATSGSYTDLINKPSLFSGSYTDLTNKPTIPSVPTTVSSFTNDAGYLTSVGAINYSDLTNKPSLFSGSYTDLTNKPSLFSGAYTDLTDKPTLSTVATSGSYTDLTNKPTSAFSNQYIVSGTTTNATETEIFVNGVASTRISIPLNTAVYYMFDVVGRRTDTSGDYAAFHIKGLASNISGTTSDIGSLYEVVIAKTDASFQVDVRADNTTDTINVYVTGSAGKTMSWKCSVTTTEV